MNRQKSTSQLERSNNNSVIHAKVYGESERVANERVRGNSLALYMKCIIMQLCASIPLRIMQQDVYHQCMCVHVCVLLCTHVFDKIILSNLIRGCKIVKQCCVCMNVYVYFYIEEWLCRSFNKEEAINSICACKGPAPSRQTFT